MKPSVRWSGNPKQYSQCLRNVIFNRLFPFDLILSPVRELPTTMSSYRWGSLKPRKAVTWWKSHSQPVVGPKASAPCPPPTPWHFQLHAMLPCHSGLGTHTPCTTYLSISPPLSSAPGALVLTSDQKIRWPPLSSVGLGRGQW